MQNKIKVVFIGGQKLGSSIFNIFANSNMIDIGLVYELELDTHEIKDYMPIDEKIKNKNILCKYKCTKRLTSNDIDNINEYKPDYIFVINWRTIFDNKLLKIAKYGTIGIHASDLPKYKGFAPINWALINGENKLGISIFYLVDEVDCGDIIQKEYINILDSDDIHSLFSKVELEYINMFKILLPNLDSIQAKKQIGISSYTCKRKPEDGKIDFNILNSRSIYNLIRALKYPFPMAFFKFNKKYIFINNAEIIEEKKYIGIVSGRIVAVNDGSINVLCNDGYVLKINEVSVSEVLIPKKVNFIKPSEIFSFGDTLY